MADYKRLAGEDFDTYALRLYSNKVEYGLNSRDIAAILNSHSDIKRVRVHGASITEALKREWIIRPGLAIPVLSHVFYLYRTAMCHFSFLWII